MPSLVTCLLPAYNHQAFVAESVRSVLTPANEGLVEVIAVDDGSSDGTYDELARLDVPGLRVFRNETNHGLAATLRRALGLVRTPYLCSLASDDRWLPGRLETQLATLESGAQWSFGRAHVIDERGTRTSTEPQGWPPDPDGMLPMLLRGQAVYAPTLMYRTELLNRIGGVPDVLWEDLAVTLRFAAVAQPMFHPEALVEYRVHGGNAHLGIVHARRHFHAHAEAVRSLAEWPALPKEHLTSVHDHLAVLDWLDGYLLGGRRLAELRSLPKQPLELVLRRQASDLVRDLSRGDVHRMEAFLWLFGARRAASALAEVLGAPFWTRATRKITRARR